MTALVVIVFAFMMIATISNALKHPNSKLLRFSRGYQRVLASSGESSTGEYSIADQKQRQAKAIKDKNPRVLNIDSIYDTKFLQDKTVLVTGGNRGIGRAIVDALINSGRCKHVIATSRQPTVIPGATIISNIDVTDNNCGGALAKELEKLPPVDILINNAGYFYEPVETLENLNFDEEMKMIDICAIGPLRITSALYKHHRFASEGAKVVMITSQGGSITWRFVQNPEGQDYGHHMSKAAANMAGVLLAQELRKSKIAVGILHPGFNKTDMTKKYEAIWQEEGALDSSIGAKRVIHEIGRLTLENTGSFINCEDGLRIPF